eukprot:TRINITY_DN7760_c0_g1_i1.p2 TRINITY_DN7760_c0_g1~~TRINITY_DN7760_c0_g1_i1.p2  ORF type:complete len:111 (+),score=27.28 TRINITY_DN7760_c0_g1_i1:39-371(+)
MYSREDAFPICPHQRSLFRPARISLLLSFFFPRLFFASLAPSSFFLPLSFCAPLPCELSRPSCPHPDSLLWKEICFLIPLSSSLFPTLYCFTLPSDPCPPGGTQISRTLR